MTEFCLVGVCEWFILSLARWASILCGALGFSKFVGVWTVKTPWPTTLPMEVFIRSHLTCLGTPGQSLIHIWNEAHAPVACRRHVRAFVWEAVFTKFTKRLIIVVSCCSLEFVRRIVVWGFSTGSFWQCRHISDLKTDQSCHQHGEMSPGVRVYECVSLCKLQSAAKPIQLRHLRLSSLVPSGTR